MQQAQELGEALRLDPALLAARIELAEILRAKDPKAGLKLLDEAADWQKKALAFITARNWTLFALNDGVAARQGVDAALALGRTPEVLYQDAVLRYVKKDFAGARTLLEEALSQNPEHMAALNLLAQSYAEQGNNAKAIEIVQQYAAKKPSSPYLGSLIGIWQRYAHHLPEARAAFLAVIAANQIGRASCRERV